MIQFIELTSKTTGTRIALRVADITRVYEEDDGCFIVMYETKRSGYGPSVQESYHTVMAMLKGQIKKGGA